MSPFDGMLPLPQPLPLPLSLPNAGMGFIGGLNQQQQLVPVQQQMMQQQAPAQQQLAPPQQAQHAEQRSPPLKAGGGRGVQKGGGRGGRGEAGTSEEERKARNRATQARFRERQKARNGQLGAQHAALEAGLEQSMSQKAELETQNAVLQKLLMVKDGVLVVLNDAGGTPGQPQAQGQLQLQQGQALQAQQQQGSGQQPQRPPQQLALDQQPGTQAATAPAVADLTAGISTGLSNEAAAAIGDLGAAATPPQRSLSGSGGISSTLQQHMDWLGHELTAQLAMLELPANADPDEAMARAHARLAPLMEQPLPPLLPHAHPHLRQLDQGQASGSGSGPEDYSVAAAAASSLQQSGSSGAAASSITGSFSGSASAASGMAVEAMSPAASSPHAGGSSQPIGLAALAQQRPDLVRQVTAMSAEEFVADWETNASAFRRHLAAYDASHDTNELEQILGIFKSWGGSLSLTLHLKPENAQALFSTAADAPAGTWERTAAALAPTQAQRSMLRQLWHSFAGRTQALRAERMAAVRAVQHAAAASVTPSTLPATTLNGLMGRYLSLFDAAGALSSLRDAEFVCLLQLMARVGAVFSPVQKARAVATCYPCFPDTVQITRLLAQEGLGEGQAAVAEQAAAGGPGPGSWAHD